VPKDEQVGHTGVGGTPHNDGSDKALQPFRIDSRAEPSTPPLASKHTVECHDADDDRYSSPELQLTKNNYKTEESPPPFVLNSDLSMQEESDCLTPGSTDSVPTFYGIPLSKQSEDEGEIKRLKKRRRKKKDVLGHHKVTRS
jgi:hypothetical protein